MSDYKMNTKCVQSGYRPGNGEPRQIPIVQSTTFKYSTSEDMGKLFDLEASGYFYSRLQNPTNDHVAAKIAAMEGGTAAMLTSSGQAANFLAFFNICECGDHIVASSSIYGGTFNLIAVTLKKMGISATFVSPDATEDELTDQADQETMGISDNTEVGEAASENTDTTYLEKAALEENVELNSDEEDIGEAVLTSAQTMKSNLATAKLNREQSRARSKEALLAIINDETMDSAAKDEAVNSYVKLTDTIEKETDAETVLTAKGYTDCIVTVNDDTVDVTLPVANLSDTERAQVEDIVTRKTGYDVSQLVITVAEDK